MFLQFLGIPKAVDVSQERRVVRDVAFGYPIHRRRWNTIEAVSDGVAGDRCGPDSMTSPTNSAANFEGKRGSPRDILRTRHSRSSLPIPAGLPIPHTSNPVRHALHPIRTAVDAARFQTPGEREQGTQTPKIYSSIPGYGPKTPRHTG